MATSRNKQGRQPGKKPQPSPAPKPATSALALYESATSRIQDQIGHQAGTVANGGCDSHETYLKMTGSIKGMQIALKVLEESLQGLGNDNDGDQLPEMP